MRLTTKIVLGIIASITLISIISIIALSFADRNKNILYPKINESGETISIEIPLYKTVILTMDDDSNTERRNDIHLSGMMNFLPIEKEADRNKLVIPKQLKPFINISEQDGILKIHLRTNHLLSQYNPTGNRFNIEAIGGIDLTLFTDSSVNVGTNVRGIGVHVVNLDVNSIDISMLSGFIQLDSCKTDRITPLFRENWNNGLLIKDSQVKELNVDLDLINNWRVENCDIEVENLTGSSNHEVYLPKSESQVMNWTPKRKEASLSVRLGADTTRVTFP